MSNKHLSENIAAVFIIAGVIILIPAILGIVPAFLIMLTGILTAQIVIFLFGLIPLSIFAGGMILFIGYLKHAGGNLTENKVLLLWFGTLAYNGLPLFMTLLSLIFGEDYRNSFVEKIGDDNFSMFSLALLCWWIIATCLSLTAIYDEFARGKDFN